ncbi:G-protein beta WD 40 repeat-containing protein [Penicillium sp. IBT 16267x]|nr:G-protein beta WD 40 repeat-containing protein [Penicillium sp. IBT 16267x]
MPKVERTWRIALLNSVDYAATFWVQHLKEVKRAVIVQNVLNEQDEVGKFLRVHLLKWLECLSLLGKLGLALEAFKTLADITTIS